MNNNPNDSLNKNEHMFSEDDLKRLFGTEEESLVVEFNPEVKSTPVPPAPASISAPTPVPISHQPIPSSVAPLPLHPTPKQPKPARNALPSSMAGGPVKIKSVPPQQIPKLTDVRRNYQEKHPILNLIFKSIGVFLLVFVISFTIINWQSIIAKFRYSVNSQYYDKTTNTKAPTVVKTESRLYIPKIGVDVPIIWNVSENDTISNLENGVIQYAGTAMPGQTGNVFISGHSSYYIWADGDYKDVFALLNHLSNNDLVYIYYNGVKFTYKVTGEKTVWPDDLSVLETNTGHNTLSLMTCVPIGTNIKRLVITAEQISTN